MYVRNFDVRRDPRAPVRFYSGGHLYAINPACETPGCGHVTETHELDVERRQFTRCHAPGCGCTYYRPGATDLGARGFHELDDDVILGLHGGVTFKAEILPGSTFLWPPRRRRAGRLVKCAAALVTAWRVYKVLRGRR